MYDLKIPRRRRHNVVVLNSLSTSESWPDKRWEWPFKRGEYCI
jgi:hypothetical protein